MKSHLPKKGKLQKTIAGEKNLIKIAYDVKLMLNLLMQEYKKLQTSTETEMNLTNNEISYELLEVDSEDNELTLPDILLSNFSQLKLVATTFDLDSETLIENESVTDENIFKQSNILLSLLRKRLIFHFNCRFNESLHKKNHQMISQINKNLELCSAMAIYFHCIKEDVSYLNESKSLLAGLRKKCSSI